MKPSFVSTSRYLLSRVTSPANKILGSLFLPSVETPVEGTVTLNARSEKKTIKNLPVFVKSHRFFLPDEDLFLLEHEAAVLNFLKELNGLSGVLTPTFLKFHKSHHQCSLQTVFVSGKKIVTESETTKVTVLEKIVRSLRSVPLDQKTKTRNLPTKTDRFFLLSFPLFLVKALLKNHHLAGPLLKSAAKFYWFWLLTLPFKKELALCHRDLDSDNIKLTKEGQTVIFDWENACLSDGLYDLAQLPRTYLTEISSQVMTSLVSKFVRHSSKKHRFIYLAVYGTIQSLALDDPGSLDHKESVKFLISGLNQLFAQLAGQKLTLFEILNAATLALVGRLCDTLKIKGKSPIILCYHDISEVGWRFSTTPSDFESQVDTLLETHRIVSLQEAVASKKKADQPVAAITFDDGYQSVHKNALRILRKRGLSATVFALGKPDRANRHELENTLPIMSMRELKHLGDLGWEIGFHTNTHPDLTKISPIHLNEEVVQGKQKFEKAFGRKITSFAYPKGHYNNFVIDQVKNAGFKFAFTVDGGILNTTMPLKITRLPVEGVMTPEEFAGLISPLGTAVTGALMTILKTKEQFLGKLIRKTV